MSAAATVEADTLPPELTPGAMERTLSRELKDGSLIEFEQAPAGWVGKGGKPREKPWRAYFYTSPDGDRVRFPSTTTLLDGICPKPGLPPWAEREGIKGAVEAMALGLITADTDPAEAVAIVHANKLGADAVKHQHAERGLNVHAINEHYMLTGNGPKLSEHPEHHRPFIIAWSKWVLARKPEPVAVELLVAHPEDGYAGRLDLRARIGGRLETIDFKTQENAGIYTGAHYQAGLYERAAVRCGEEIADGRRVVVLAGDGTYDEMAADHDDQVLLDALAFYRSKRPIDSFCDARNQREKKARR